MDLTKHVERVDIDLAGLKHLFQLAIDGNFDELARTAPQYTWDSAVKVGEDPSVVFDPLQAWKEYVEPIGQRMTKVENGEIMKASDGIAFFEEIYKIASSTKRSTRKEPLPLSEEHKNIMTEAVCLVQRPTMRSG